MDETTKILIGTISGFVIAFLAEPVKTHFETTARRKNLRRMLYHEIFENYSRLQVIRGTDAPPDDFNELASSIIKVDCYNYAISNELSTYYQLREASSFNTIYSITQTILATDPSPDFRDKLIELYSTNLSSAIASGDIDVKYFRKLKRKEDADEILKQLDFKD